MHYSFFVQTNLTLLAEVADYDPYCKDAKLVGTNWGAMVHMKDIPMNFYESSQRHVSNTNVMTQQLTHNCQFF